MNNALDETAKYGSPEFVGLSAAEVASQRAKFGPNAVVEEEVHRLKKLARQFWAPVPWMLEVTILLQVALGQWLTASVFTRLRID